jgi:hypothetical protein
MSHRSILPLTAALICLSAPAFAYNFWGATLTTANHGSDLNQLAFTNVGINGIKGVGGSYKYTRIDTDWSGPNSPASPGLGWGGIHYKFDAMGLFFKAEADEARFMIFAGMPVGGTTAGVLGYPISLTFGPGDLRIEAGADNYGVGLRKGDLNWTLGSSSPYFQIHSAIDGSVPATDVRKSGSVTGNDIIGYTGTINKNPAWYHTDNPGLDTTDPLGQRFAFFDSASGQKQADSAAVSYADTGIALEGYHVYAYEARVPWEALGIDHPGDDYDFWASSRPDCGNSIIKGHFTGKREIPPPIPEPNSVLLMLGGMAAFGLVRRRR